MFDQLKNLGNIMQQASQMQSRMQEVKDKVAETRVEGSAGGDMVKVEASGDMRILNIQIEQSLVDSADKEMLEELVCAATNQALQKAKEEAQAAMQDVAGGMNIPGLSEAMSKFGMGN